MLLIQPPAYVPTLAPNEIQAANLKGWWRAEDVTVGAGNSVPSWADQSGNGNNLIQGTVGAQPYFRANIFGNRPAVEFASDDFLTCDAIGTLLSGSDMPFTLAMVMRATTAGSNQILWSLGSSSSGTPFHYGSNNTATNQFTTSRRGNTSGQITGTGTGAGTSLGNRIVIWRFNGTTIDLFYDGVRGLNALAMDTDSLTINQFTIGAFRRNTTGNFSNYYLGGAALWNAGLTIDEIGGLSNDLNQKWFA